MRIVISLRFKAMIYQLPIRLTPKGLAQDDRAKITSMSTSPRTVLCAVVGDRSFGGIDDTRDVVSGVRPPSALGSGNATSFAGLIVQHEFPQQHFLRVVNLVVPINQFNFCIPADPAK